MSDFFADDAGPQDPMPPHAAGGRRPRPLILTLIVMALLIIGFSIFANIWTDKLWFASLDRSDVFNKLLWTKVGLFVVFGLLMGLIVGGNLWTAFRIRPAFRSNTPDQANLDRYREVITPIRKVLLIATSLVFAIFAGASATGKWQTYLLWQNSQSFGRKDPYFHKDVGFYVFTLPWLHWLVSFTMTAMVIGLIAGLFVHYVYGGIRLQSRSGKVSSAAQAHISVLLGLLVLLKGIDYYLGRFDLTSADGGLVTGMTYSREHAVLPSKNILIAIAIICAGLFFANLVRRTWMLPAVGLALFGLSAILLGMLWPAIVQQFQVKPDEPDKEAAYIQKNITATRDAFDIKDVKVTTYPVSTTLDTAVVKNSSSIPGIRLLDPRLVRAAFEQLQQQKAYYTVQPLLDVDHYSVGGTDRDMVVAAREVYLNGLPDSQKNWANEHTVYTHGYGLIAAYGNQRNQQGVAVAPDAVGGTGGQPIWAESNLPPTGVLGDSQSYQARVYFGELSPTYSIVGKAPGGRDVELDTPESVTNPGHPQTSTYTGKGGVSIGSFFNKLLYATKFGDPNLVLSSRVHADSKILYDRSPRERVQKVAPWLTVDSDALPSVVDGRVVWILDGYTTTDMYPLSQRRSLTDMTSDAVSPRSAYATLPTDNINYMRNAVKATVDAYDGTVTLYAWDAKDPILKAWESAFPGVVKPKSDIPKDLLAHFRYPEDMYKVQRNMLASYHVTNAKTFYAGTDRWEVPADPDQTSTTQPPYRLSIAPVATTADPNPSTAPVFSLTSVYVPSKKSNLAAFMSVGADAADSSTYGKFQILRLPDSTQVPGPGNISNTFSTDPKVTIETKNYKGGTAAHIRNGNLLTIPVDGGMLYVQPLYTIKTGGSGNYPLLSFVVASYGNQVGIGPTLAKALDNIGQGGGDSTPGSTGGTTPSTPNTPATGLSDNSFQLLKQANRQFNLAQQSLGKKDLVGYAQHVAQGQALLRRAIQAEAAAVRNKSAHPTPTPSPTPTSTPTAKPTN